MWSPNELLKIEKQRDILSYITLQFFHFKKVPLEHCPFASPLFLFLHFILNYLQISSWLIPEPCQNLSYPSHSARITPSTVSIFSALHAFPPQKINA